MFLHIRTRTYILYGTVCTEGEDGDTVGSVWNEEGVTSRSATRVLLVRLGSLREGVRV